MTGSTTAPPQRHVAAGTAPRTAARLLVTPLRAGQEHVLIVVGEADISTADRLRDHLIDALAEHPPALRVELGGLEFCDSSGLDALHDAEHAAAAAGVPLTFSAMSAQLGWLHRTFPRTGTTTTEPHKLFSVPSGAGR